MSVQLLRTTAAKISIDPNARWVFAGVFCVSAIVFVTFGTFAALSILLFYISGLVLATLSLNNKPRVSKWIQSGKDYFGYKDCIPTKERECTACGVLQCQRHIVEVEQCTLWLDEELDRAVSSFYSIILNNFIRSWFSTLSEDEAFLHLVRISLRDATCRLGVALKSLDMPKLITERLLPVIFSHQEVVSKMMLDGVTMDQFGNTFVLQELPMHPAVCNRQAEIKYLRTVAKSLIPKLITTQQYSSKVFYSLLREIIAGFVLLPLLDVIADPNLLNALIIAATDPPVKRVYKDGIKVAFLESFVYSNANIAKVDTTIDVVPTKDADDDDLLQDQTKLYAFMQFLKREGVVDLLRFHLDVDHLNSELQDPRVTTDPAKLSALQQQSEKLLNHYRSLVEKMRSSSDLTVTDELNVAHEMIKQALHGKWKREFKKTPEYFKLVYGDTSIAEVQVQKRPLEQSNSSKRKGVPVEGAEAAWDGFGENSSTSSSQSQQSQQNATIYSSVTQKLRKERGQNLDQFMASFMQSVEQSTDVGEDVITTQQQQQKKKDKKDKELNGPPGRNLVFGDLFELRSPPNGKEALNYHLHPVRGPSKCFIYIVAEILRYPTVVIKFMISLVNISKQTVDSIICSLLQKLLNTGLYEPRLAVLINLLKDQLFGSGEAEEKKSEPTPTELLERQRLARERLVALNGHLGSLADMLQSPPMNKHLIYSLFDVIVDEMYPDLLLSMEEDKEE